MRHYLLNRIEQIKKVGLKITIEIYFFLFPFNLTCDLEFQRLDKRYQRRVHLHYFDNSRHYLGCTDGMSVC
jgi:hypothetical protein